MDFAIWTENLSVDIDKIDSQHKILIQLINDSSRMILQRDNGRVKELIGELKQYTDTHFLEEEELFKSSGYPLVDKHLMEHRYFIDKLDDFDKNLTEKGHSVSLNILEFLKNWLFYHIEIVDKGYSAYVVKELQKK